MSACGRSQDSGGSSERLIGLSMRFIAGNSWLSTLSKSAVAAGKGKGYKVEAVDAQGSASRQELVTQTREDGFMAGWNEYFAANPGYTTVRVPNNYGQALPDKTLTAMRNVLAGNPDIDVIFNQTDVVMGAVKEALRGAGLLNADGSSKVVIAGFDGGMDVVKDMANTANSAVVASGLNQPPTQAAYAVDEAIAASKKQPTGQCNGAPATRILAPAIATPENAKDLVNPDLEFAGSK